MSDASNPPRGTFSLLRPLRVPLIVAAAPVLSYTVMWAWDRLDLDPAPLFPMFMVFQLLTVLALAIIFIWFFFFSGFRWRTKLLGPVCVLALFGLWRWLVRKIEFNGQMRPTLVFRWEPDYQEALAHRLQEPNPAATRLPPVDLTIAPTDYPRYRGVNNDGVVAPVSLPMDWTARPPPVLWRQAVGGGYSGFAVVGNVAITIEQRGPQEAIVCYDRASGQERWAHAYPALFRQSEPMGGDGPRATPTIADGDIYSLGAMGDLVCLDGTSGKPRWTVNILSDSEARNVDWGMTSSPLVVGSVVVVNAGIDPEKNVGRAIVAYDRKTGRRVWAAGDKPAGYSSPMLARLAGMEQIVLFDGGGLVGLDPADGRELWRHAWKTFSEMNIIQPVALPGERFFISSELSNGCAVVQVRRTETGWSTETVWKNRYLCSKFSNPVLHGGHLYGMTNGILVCVDALTGERRWKEGRFGIGQILLSGDVLLIQSESGDLAAVAADPAEYRELGRMSVFSGKTWNTPALAGGRLYLRTHQEMVCLQLGE